MGIDNQHKDYQKHLAKWQMIDNICSGDNVDQYLLTLNPGDKSPENHTRNEQYKKRAIFYAIAGYTARGLNGLLFSKWPKFTYPPQLEYMAKNVDGAGNSIYQQAQDTGEDQIKKGRAGLFTTYPETEGPSSREDMAQMKAFATIHKIEAEQIRDWDVITDGANVKLGLVVWEEVVSERKGYEVTGHDQLRELTLESNVFVDRKWRKNKAGEWVVLSESIPTDGAGKSWDVIPFTFVGSENNTPTVDEPPMLGLVDINRGHYRNSADYEDNVWFCGQAQSWMSGVTQAHVDLMKNNNMYVGSRALIAVPDGGQFGFAAAPANVQVRQAMMDKIEMMIGLGARFIHAGSAPKTAYEASQDSSVQHSILSLISSNLSGAYTQCLIWAARYMNASEDVEFLTTMDFVSPTATAQELQAMIAGFVQGAVPVGAYFKWLQKHGIEDEEKTIEEFAEEVAVVGVE